MPPSCSHVLYRVLPQAGIETSIDALKELTDVPATDDTTAALAATANEVAGVEEILDMRARKSGLYPFHAVRLVVVLSLEGAQTQCAVVA